MYYDAPVNSGEKSRSKKSRRRKATETKRRQAKRACRRSLLFLLLKPPRRALPRIGADGPVITGCGRSAVFVAEGVYIHGAGDGIARPEQRGSLHAQECRRSARCARCRPLLSTRVLVFPFFIICITNAVFCPQVRAGTFHFRRKAFREMQACLMPAMPSCDGVAFKAVRVGRGVSVCHWMTAGRHASRLRLLRAHRVLRRYCNLPACLQR